jgi:2-enoate reductase
MVITDCFTAISRKIDPYSHEKRIYKGPRPYTLSEIAADIALYGSIPAIQFSPGLGASYKGRIDPDNPPLDVSSFPCRASPEIMCREMSADDIHTRIMAFGEAAEIAYQAGFQVIHFNSHGGYLFPRFLSPIVNKRKDKYGGTPENRFRFLREIVEEIRSRLGDKIVLMLRLSLERLDYLGTTFKDSIEYCKMAGDAGFDALDVDAGSPDNEIYYFYPAMYLGPTPLVEYTRMVKRVVKIPVGAVGAYLHPDQAEKIIAGGDADMVFLGRPILADPRWVEKARRGKTSEICYCIQCNERCVDNIAQGKMLGCSVNPRCGYETKYDLRKVERPKQVVIVGAGPAGIQAALVAHKKGHNVTILEKNSAAGGQLELASREEFKIGVKYYLDYLRNMLVKDVIDVRYNCEAGIEAIKALNPDTVIAATGAISRHFDIPGSKNNSRVHTIESFMDWELKEHNPIPKKIVIIGGGLIACESALGLYRKGWDVTVVVRRDVIASGMSNVNRRCIMDQFSKSSIKILTKVVCNQIEDSQAFCVDAGGKQIILNFDIFLAAVGMDAFNPLKNVLQEEFEEVYFIGDCVKPGKISDAVYQGFYAGLRL